MKIQPPSKMTLNQIPSQTNNSGTCVLMKPQDVLGRAKVVKPTGHMHEVEQSDKLW